MGGLDFNNNGYLRGRVGRRRNRRSASRQFQDLWDKLDAEREKRGLLPETVADKSGFGRSSYFEYAKHGHIPFNALEAMAACLKASIRATVQTAEERIDDPSRTSTEGVMLDYIEPILELLRKYPEDQQPVIAGVIIGAAVRAVNELPPFGGPAVSQSSARLGRKK